MKNLQKDRASQRISLFLPEGSPLYLNFYPSLILHFFLSVVVCFSFQPCLVPYVYCCAQWVLHFILAIFIAPLGIFLLQLFLSIWRSILEALAGWLNVISVVRVQ